MYRHKRIHLEKKMGEFFRLAHLKLEFAFRQLPHRFIPKRESLTEVQFPYTTFKLIVKETDSFLHRQK